MRIEDFLALENAFVGVNAPDKARLITDLSARAAAGIDSDAAMIARELMKREALGSTGLGGGIALPHTRLKGLQKPFGLLARLKRPLDFEAIDGRPVDLVFLLLQPLAEMSDLNALAAVARALRDGERLERLRTAPGGGDLYRAMTS